jgi:4-aminobutyrate aminotransferase-like enzyme
MEWMPDDRSLVARRHAILGRGAPLFYDRPLHIVRGEGCWLWDADGRRFLDAYNNVPHVGHCHPLVTEAICRQSERLNIHTRYLHEGIVDYAERLTATFPGPLDRAMFCCTGTEANELALRIARTASGHQGVIVSSFSYHGNSSGLAVLTTGLPTPESFASFGRAVPIPDPFRWRGEGGEDGMVAHHLALADEAIASLEAAGFGVAAVLFDSIFSTEGLLDVPPAYIRGVAERVRRAGGLYIADEVQPGFGRMGDAMWGFEAAGIVPDFVTLGKPMGNGHPIAAVITRSELADDFSRDALYFNTFAGNPVSAAVGRAVLDVIADERLMERAAATGDHLQHVLERLSRNDRRLGNVRGRGLFAAVEIVNRAGGPDSGTTRAIVNGMRDRGVLISRIGPQDNVLKIRPPLAFGTAEADQLVSTLEEVLAAMETSA